MQFLKFSFAAFVIALLAIGCCDDEDFIPRVNGELPEDSITLAYIQGNIFPQGEDSSLRPRLSCNGHPELCDKRISDVFFAMTHNSHAHSGTFSPLSANQNGNVLAQLNAGIRGLNIKPYWESNGSCGNGLQGLYLYHGSPFLGCEPLADFLFTVKNFMNSNPRECIVLTIEGSANAERLDSIFTYTGLNALMYDHAGGDWPTLAAMIASNQRLVVLSDRSDAESFPGQHRMWSHVVDVNYDIQNVNQFDCTFDRGNPDGGFFLLNHFLTNVTPQAGSAGQANAFDLLYNRALQCWDANDKRPNFVMVDFYATGDVVRVVDSLNLRP